MRPRPVHYQCLRSPTGNHGCPPDTWPVCEHCREPLFVDDDMQLYCYVHLIHEEPEWTWVT